ncbi:MAG: TonB-dependent receptor [Betaproteobacteria bacterium]|nr:TonB-dependent receptor [Betaproteobacteria bacterium]
MGNPRPIQLHLVGSLFFSLSMPVLAQPQEIVLAPEVVVTASRLDQPLTDTIAHTTVITQKDIRESQAADLPSLLRREAGFEFVQNGGIGTSSSIFMRGGDGRQTLILIDGVRVGSATLGTTSIEHVMLDQVERVEIVRGNVSALYGANAIGGVIQIFTKQGYGAPRAEARAMAGSRGTNRVSGGYSGGVDDTRFSLNVSRFQTNGFSAIDTRQAPRANPDNDGYRNESFSGQLSQRLAAGHEIGLRAYQSAGNVNFDSAFGTPTNLHTLDATLSSYALSSENQFTSSWKSRVTVAQGADKSTSFTNGARTGRFNTENMQYLWQNDFSLARGHVITAGLERQQQRVDSTTVYQVTGRKVNGAVLAYSGRLNAHQLQASIRRDQYSDFGGADTWLTGYGYEINPRWKLTAMRSNAFTAPTFNQLFFPGFGNPGLQPEKALSNELGLQYAAGTHLLRLALFHTEYRNLIQSVAVAPGVFQSLNIGQARVEGAELSYTGQFDGWDIRASLTAQDPINTATGAQLRRRGKTFGNLSVNTTLSGWRLGAETIVGSSRPDNNIVSGAPVTLGGYTVVNLTARYPLSKSTFIAARLENAFDEHYQVAHGFNTPGRGLFASLAWQQ